MKCKILVFEAGRFTRDWRLREGGTVHAEGCIPWPRCRALGKGGSNHYWPRGRTGRHKLQSARSWPWVHKGAVPVGPRRNTTGDTSERGADGHVAKP
jgi:hypothetical protein